MGLADFAIGLLNSVLNLPEGQVKLNFKKFKLRRTAINAAHQEILGAS